MLQLVLLRFRINALEPSAGALGLADFPISRGCRLSEVPPDSGSAGALTLALVGRVLLVDETPLPPEGLLDAAEEALGCYRSLIDLAL